MVQFKRRRYSERSKVVQTGQFAPSKMPCINREGYHDPVIFSMAFPDCSHSCREHIALRIKARTIPGVSVVI